MKQFNIDYKLGKQSEAESLDDLNKIFNTKLIHDPEIFSHFDFHNDDIMVELKTRPDTYFENGVMYNKSNYGIIEEIDDLIFDSIKMAFAYQHNKRLVNRGEKPKDFYLVWKCRGDYFYWKLNWDKQDYKLKNKCCDFGKGRREERDIVHVKLSAITAPCYIQHFERQLNDP